MSTWYEPLEALQSKGSTADRPGSLGGLARAREIHQGQFFTPAAIVRAMWDIPAKAMAEIGDCRSIDIIDNSLGSARMFQFAEPDKHRLFGLDVDGECVAAVSEAARQAGFDFEFEACGMESARPRNMDVAFINPPFSLHLESPLLQPFPCTTYGKFGPNTSTVSHAYALAQAVEAADVVVALLPATFAAEMVKDAEAYLHDWDAPRLAAHVELPAGSFKEEGTDVRVALLVFDSVKHEAVARFAMTDLGDMPSIDLMLRKHKNVPALAVSGVDDQGPSIVLPVTGDKRVRVSHDGRRIRLGFGCGLTQARVQNAILVDHVNAWAPEGHRHPKGVRYTGQGRLDLEVHLAQENPRRAFEELIEDIARAGGEPDVAPGVREHLQRRIQRSRRQGMPLRHTVWVKPGTAGAVQSIKARARKDHVANPKVWGSPLIAAGTEIEFVLQADGRYDFQRDGSSYRLSPEELAERYEVTLGARASGWTVVHEGVAHAYPQLAHAIRAKALRLGIDKWLTWQFQLDDLVELAIKPVGTIAAWEMGLGKARLASAMILLSGVKHGLVTTEAGLVDEMEIELKGLPIPRSAWKIIRKPSDLDELTTINVIAYERLRLPLDSKATDEEAANEEGRKRKAVVRMHKTYAGRLRRRCGLVVSDEGDLLSNPDSAQSRALWHLSAKRRYVLTGTPLANYPRDIAPTLAYTAGDGTAAQPWGWHRGRLEKAWFKSMSHAERGIDAFRETFVCTEWVTREFQDTLTEGAKREIPRIANLAQYRVMLAPHVKRRIAHEPEVAACVKMPKADRITTVLPWDEGHLAFYLEIAEEFRQWYLNARKDEGRRSNLIAILARIQAVGFAQDYPQHGVKGFGSYHRLTSKQRYIIERTAKLVGEGRKTILYAENPGMLEIYARHLDEAGVESVLFHGGIAAGKRMRELNRRYRFGDAPNLAASLGVTQKGLNLPQADYMIMASRSWSATVEDQAIGRPLRPQQKRKVTAEYVHLDGGLDLYKAQLVEFKKDAARAGLDWAEPETDGLEFLHLDTVLERFCHALAEMKGVGRHDLRLALAA